MNMVQNVVKMYARDKWGWFILPWVILLSSFFVNLFIAAFLPVDEQIVTGGLISIFIYMMVIGIVSLSQTFPFALGLSVRRRDFFLGSMLMISLLSAAISVILCVLSYIEGSVIEGWGVQLSFFHLPYVSDGNVLAQFVIFFSCMISLYMTGFLCASVHRRYGRNGMYVFSIVAVLVMTVILYIIKYLGWWSAIFDFLGDHSAVQFAVMLLPLAICLSFASYLLLRRATV
ncbi:hypothetical protein [Paenibacillus sp. CF384]|uniref:hypothetical protein n=1 Tax=Paenibacillus sp. CF384 TaxID=1884382 RepID=UPI00089470DA|nr:hypothetical protein [Paenibacillus sp. CF384]SDW12127.1 hypothetical protein SAMN05518855_1001330 [Paenibacillus sp. CF384]